jgi:hypothetical protein
MPQCVRRCILDAGALAGAGPTLLDLASSIHEKRVWPAEVGTEDAPSALRTPSPCSIRLADARLVGKVRKSLECVVIQWDTAALTVFGLVKDDSATDQIDLRPIESKGFTQAGTGVQKEDQERLQVWGRR